MLIRACLCVSITILFVLFVYILLKKTTFLFDETFVTVVSSNCHANSYVIKSIRNIERLLWYKWKFYVVSYWYIRFRYIYIYRLLPRFKRSYCRAVDSLRQFIVKLSMVFVICDSNSHVTNTNYYTHEKRSPIIRTLDFFLH